MTISSKKEFREKLREFKIVNVGAACFKDANDKTFCANNMTPEKAQEFARIHGLQVIGFHPGAACTEVNC
jgi:hypothetical protein